MDPGRPRTTRTRNHEANILQSLGENPNISSIQVDLVCCTTHSTAWSQDRHKHQINVCAGNVDDYLVGTYALRARLTGAVYKDIIPNTLPDLLDEVNLTAAHAKDLQ